MRDLDRVIWLIERGEAETAGAWARLVARAAFSLNYHLRSYRSDR